MRVDVQVSGGVTGVRMGGALDTATLDPELADQVETALAPGRLASASERASRTMPDQRQWTVTVEDRQFELADSQLDDDQVAALDALVAETVRRRRGG